MRITSKMFNDNPNLSPKEVMDRISKKRHKSDKRMPTREERRTEIEIKQMESRS